MAFMLTHSFRLGKIFEAFDLFCRESLTRSITFVVKRVDRGTTSVSIDPESQKVFGGAELLKVVGSTLAREIKT